MTKAVTERVEERIHDLFPILKQFKVAYVKPLVQQQNNQDCGVLVISYIRMQSHEEAEVTVFDKAITRDELMSEVLATLTSVSNYELIYWDDTRNEKLAFDTCNCFVFLSYEQTVDHSE